MYIEVRGVFVIYENTLAIFDKKSFPYACMLQSSRDNVDYHCHKEVEIIYMVSGTLEILYNHQTHKLQTGGVFIIAPYVAHAYLNPSNDCTRLVHVVDFTIVSTINSDFTMAYDVDPTLTSFFQQMAANSINWPVESKDMIIGLLERMYKEYCVKEYAWEMAIMVLVSQILLVCLRQIPRSEEVSKSKEIDRIQSILRYIASHFNTRIFLQECAEELKLNPSYLSRFFKKCMGITFQDYVKNSRIEKSKILLLSSQTPITEICYEAGFTDISTFNKLFRASVGCSPTRYRKDNTITDILNQEVINYQPKAM